MVVAAAATPVVIGYAALALAQSVPFLWWRRVPMLAAGLAAAVLAIRTGLGQNSYSAAAATGPAGPRARGGVGPVATCTRASPTTTAFSAGTRLVAITARSVPT